MPSLDVAEFDYAALLYYGEKSPANPQHEDFTEGTVNGDKIHFSFQRPNETSGLTLEIFAFAKTEGAAQFSKGSALLSGSKDGLTVSGDEIIIIDAIPLNIASTKPGTVSLKIKVPSECSLFISETNENGAIIAENEARFTVTGTSPEFIVMQKDANGISAGAYQVNFTVKKGEEIVQMFSEYINVLSGMRTDTWSGSEKGAAKDVMDGISRTVYVRGTGGWYDKTSPYNDGTTAMADDKNSGSLLSPLATIQKAVDTVIARNCGEPSEPYIIYVDGTLNGTTAAYLGASGMADFTALDKNLTLTIKALSGTATLDGDARFDSNGNVTNAGIGKSVIFAKSKPDTDGKVNLTLENLTITGGNKAGNGAGVYLNSPGGTLTIGDGTTISGNRGGFGGGISINSGAFTMTGGTVSGNWSTQNSGGVDIGSGGASFTMTGGTISGNTAQYGGGMLVASGGNVTMSGGEITGNTATGNGGGVYNRGTFAMSGSAKISENNASQDGGGVYVTKQGEESAEFTMSGGTISGNTAKAQGDGDTNDSGGGGLYVCENSTFTMTGGMISKNLSSKNGGGIFANGGTLDMTNGTVGGETTIEGNTANSCGGGIYATNSATVKLTNCAIKWCKALSNALVSSLGGGGIYNANATVEIEGGEISKCYSAFNGGGVHKKSGKLEISNCKINGNTSDNYGGGAYCASSMTIKGSTLFSGNRAKSGNGAHFAISGCNLYMGDAAKFESDDYVYFINDAFSNASAIKIIASLTAESPVATIKLSSYMINARVLNKADDVTDTLDDICKRFAVMPKADGTEYEIKPSGSYGILKTK